VNIIKDIPESRKFDVVLLDSANDPDLIFNEYLQIRKNLQEESIVIVDDVTSPGKKGDILVPYLKGQGISFEFHKVYPSNCIIFYFNGKN